MLCTTHPQGVWICPTIATTITMTITTATVKAGAEIILTICMADSLTSGCLWDRHLKTGLHGAGAFRGGPFVTMTEHNVWGGAAELPASVLTPPTLALFGNEWVPSFSCRLLNWEASTSSFLSKQQILALGKHHYCTCVLHLSYNFLPFKVESDISSFHARKGIILESFLYCSTELHGCS